MAYRIDEIEGIAPAIQKKLARARIDTTNDLLRACREAAGCKSIGRQTGLSKKQLVTWSNMADLMRISGVGPQFAELLEACGVDTVRELKHRNAENLAATMRETNVERNLTRITPGAAIVRRWIDQAQTLKPAIEH